jgi:hypothetical protein
VFAQAEPVKQQVTVFPHLACSPDLAPSDFFFFSHLKGKLCGSLFQLAEEIATATSEAIQDLPANIFQQCFQQQYQRWQTCIATNSDYFEEKRCGHV